MTRMLLFLILLLVADGIQTPNPPSVPAMTKDVRQSVAAFRGNIVILNFWATWSGPCHFEIPGFIALQNKYRDQGLEIVGVALDPLAPRGNPAGAAAVAPFMKRYGINYSILMVDNLSALAGYDVARGIPTTYVLDREGRTVKTYVGARPVSAYENDIKALLSPSRPKTECERLDQSTSDDQLYMRMLNCVSAEGVKRIPQHALSPSGDRYVFVGEFWERWETQRPPLSGEKTDLWLVNSNGTGLQRLTSNGSSYAPDWSPSGNEIVFVDKGSINILDTRSKAVRTIREVYVSSESEEKYDYIVYDQPKWSPNGKAIAVLARDGHAYWVEVMSADGFEICHFARGVMSHQWNKEGELLLDYGKFVFDWENIFSNGPPPEPKAESQESSDLLRNSLLKRVKAEGVKRIQEYVHSPSGNKIVFVGSFEEYEAMFPKLDLWIINRDGTGLRRLTHDACSHDPAWSSSGNEIAFVHCDSVSVINIRTGRERRLPGMQAYTPPAAEGGRLSHDASSNLRPRWSPNGKVIAAESGNGGTGWIIAVEARSGKEIFNSGSEVYSFSWNERGELVMPVGKFVFDWDRTFWYSRPASRIEQITSEDSASAITDPLLDRLLERVSAKGVKKIREYVPSPSGERLIFVGEFEDVWSFVGIQSGRPKTDLWLINRDGTGLRRLTTDGMSDAPAWSPTSQEIAFADEGSIKIINLRSGARRALRGLRGERPYSWECDYREYGNPVWSPNGKAILAASGNGCGGGIAVADTRAGRQFFEYGDDQADNSAWNDRSELLLVDGNGGPAKVVFDWESITKDPARAASVNLFPIRQNGKWGYVNKAGDLVIQPKFDAALRFSRGLAQVKIAGTWRLINKRGNLVASPNDH